MFGRHVRVMHASHPSKRDTLIQYSPTAGKPTLIQRWVNISCMMVGK